MRSNFSLAVTGTSRCYTTAVGAEPFKTCYKNAENLCPICTGEFRITVNGGFASSFFSFFLPFFVLAFRLLFPPEGEAHWSGKSRTKSKRGLQHPESLGA